MKVIHQQWQLTGSILLVDDDGNAIVLGKDAQGNDARTGTVAIGVDRFRGNEVEIAYQKARAACEELLQKYQAQTQTAPANVLELVATGESESQQKPA